MWKNLYLIVFLIISFSSSNSKAMEPVIYRIEFGGKFVGCLIGTDHVTQKSSSESTQLNDCSNEAPVAAFESLQDFTFSQQVKFLTRLHNDFRFSDLKVETQRNARLALKKMNFPNEAIDDLTLLHPVATLHFLTMAKVIAPDIAFKANVDLLHMSFRKKNSLPLYELEGNQKAFEHIREISLTELDKSIENISNILIHDDKVAKAKAQIENAFFSLPQNPNPQTGIEFIKKINTEILNLSPEYTFRFVNLRNQNLVDNMDRAIKQYGRALIFVGLAHFGEPHSVISLLPRKGYQLVRIQ